MPDSFRAIIARQGAPAALETLPVAELPASDVLIEVRHSSLNYKDGIALADPGKVVRRFPMVLGIDLAGVVVQSSSADFQPGQQVLVAGSGLSETRWGGFAELARLPADCLIAMPTGLSPSDAMSIGTAGLTAMLSLMALETHGLRPDSGPVLVTGACGGVGSLSIAILARAGFHVVAMTRRAQEADYLKQLGAAEIVSPDGLVSPETKALQSQRWAGAIDTVGGSVLASLCSALNEGASVAACGNAGGLMMHASVLPFILRSVNLLGINSLFPSMDRRREAWTRLAATLPSSVLSAVTSHVPLDGLFASGKEILAGRVRGRVVVDVH